MKGVWSLDVLVLPLAVSASSLANSPWRSCVRVLVATDQIVVLDMKGTPHLTLFVFFIGPRSRYSMLITRPKRA